MSWRQFGERRASRLSLSSELDFGKYSGRTLGSVLEDDPGYLWWCVENVDGFSGRLEDGLEDEIGEAAEEAE